ncbi:MAG: hypothetical protein K8S16_01400 [Bacteroidales bacterium]|nr:hypothetical protein [Bacteroidales bacterium]
MHGAKRKSAKRNDGTQFRNNYLHSNRQDNKTPGSTPEDETVWLTQEQMAMLFGKTKSTINEHI